MDSTFAARVMSRPAFASGRLLFTIALALLLGVCVALTQPRYDGDVAEYTTMAAALSSHGTPDIRAADVTRARQLAPPLTGAYDELERGMRSGQQFPLPGFARTEDDGQVYAIHFFTYSALAAAVLAILGPLGLPGTSAFIVVNMLAVTVLGAALHRLFGSASRAAVGVALFFVCGGLLYWNWNSPEIASAAALLAALAMFCTNAPVMAGLLAGMAASHNPPIVAFAGFAPAFAVLLDWRSGTSLRAALLKLNRPRVYLGAVLCVAWTAAPFLFNLAQFGIPSWITKMSTNEQLIGWPRLVSFFLDPNQGMIVGVPFLVATMAVCGWRGRRQYALLFGCAAAFTLALALPALSAVNWNSAARGVMRYGFWAAMPLLFAFLLYLRAQPVFPRALVALVLALQTLCMLNAKSYRPVEFSPAAHWILRHAPGWYNPDPELFYERLVLGELWLDPSKAYSYVAGGRITKTLYNPAGGGVRHLCGEGSMLVSRSVDAGYGGWRYFDGAPRCTSSESMTAELLARRKLLVEGWSAVEQGGGNWDGVWSNGVKSSIHLHPQGKPESAILIFKGHYFEGNRKTRVTVNGSDLGWRALDRNEGIDISEILADGYTSVEIELEHELPGGPSPDAKDTRKIAYFLQSVELR